MGQLHLSNIALQIIEKQLAAEFPLDKIITNYSNMKARKMQF